jgi:uncharacterized protein (DUF2342 family)
VSTDTDTDITVDTAAVAERIRQRLRQRRLSLPAAVLDEVVDAAVDGLVPRSALDDRVSQHQETISELVARRNAAVASSYQTGLHHRDDQVKRAKVLRLVVRDLRDIVSRLVVWSGPEDWRDKANDQLDAMERFLREPDDPDPDDLPADLRDPVLEP